MPMAVIDVTSNTWRREVSEARGMVIVDFWHEGCGWCTYLDPVIEELSGKYEGKARFAKFNVLLDEAHFQMAKQYQVMGSPTLVFFCNGQPVGELVGYRPKARLKREVDDALCRCDKKYCA